MTVSEGIPAAADWIGTGLAAVAVATSVLPAIKKPWWWVRVWDFPRLQIAAVAALGAAAAAASALMAETGAGSRWTAAAAAAAALAFQTWRIVPYTRLWPPRSAEAPNDRDLDDAFSVLIMNVLMDNRDFGRAVDLIRRCQPDIFCTVEVDDEWVDALSDAFDSDYPHAVKCPLSNTYGMALFSRLPLEDAQLMFLAENDVPSVETDVILRSGARVHCHFLHPRPPQLLQDTDNRDAEILTVAKDVRGESRPVLVAGDLNDVAWSHTTRVFLRSSGLLDHRIGRGMFNSYNARIPLVRYPLDHCFHNNRLALVRLERLENFGSDHFPILIELARHGRAPALQTAPAPEDDDLEEMEDRIQPAPT